MSPLRVIETLMKQCEEIPERVPGYRKALSEAASGVIWDESEHAIRATTVQQNVKDRCDSLGKFLFENQEDSSADA